MKRGIESGLGGEVGDADEIALGNGKEEKCDEQSGADGQKDDESFRGESELLMSEPDGKWIQENDEDDTRTTGKRLGNTENRKKRSEQFKHIHLWAFGRNHPFRPIRSIRRDQIRKTKYPEFFSDH